MLEVAPVDGGTGLEDGYKGQMGFRLRNAVVERLFSDLDGRLPTYSRNLSRRRSAEGLMNGSSLRPGALHTRQSASPIPRCSGIQQGECTVLSVLWQQVTLQATKDGLRGILSKISAGFSRSLAAVDNLVFCVVWHVEVTEVLDEVIPRVPECSVVPVLIPTPYAGTFLTTR